MKVIKWIAIILVGGFFALLALGMIIESNKSPEENAADAAAREMEKSQEQARQADMAAREQESKKAEIAALPLVTSFDIARAYEANTVAADQQFKGKRFRVTGIVTDINTDFMGDPYITMPGTDEFFQPQFSFDKSALNQLAALSKGTEVTLVCTGKGDVAKTPMSDDCQIVQGSHSQGSPEPKPPVQLQESVTDANSNEAAPGVITLVDGGDVVYTVKDSPAGKLLESVNTSIVLEGTCSASSPQHGKGKWSWANGGVLVEFEHASVGFPRQGSPFDDTRCPME